MHAPIDIARQGQILAAAQRSLGHPSYFVGIAPSCRLKYRLWGLPAILLADVVDFHYARTFSDILRRGPFQNIFEKKFFHDRGRNLDKLDLPLLKRAGKRLVFHFHGCDIRYYEDGMDYPLNACHHCYLERRAPQKKKALALMRKYADKFVVTTPDLLKFVPDAEYVPAALPIERWSFESPRTRDLPLRVVHAPTEPFSKGTRFVLNALDPLIKQGKVVLTLVRNVPYNRLLDIYRNADIAIDQMLVGWYGVFAQEMMALGKPVVCYIDPKFAPHQPDLPIISATPTTLASAMNELVTNDDLRREKGLEGRRFVERVHSSRVVAKQLINIYSSL